MYIPRTCYDASCDMPGGMRVGQKFGSDGLTLRQEILGDILPSPQGDGTT